MEEVCGTDYTVAQLRRWLQHLDLPSSGSKNELLIRINSVPMAMRGNCPNSEVGSEIPNVINLYENDVEDASGSGVEKGTNDREETTASRQQQQMIGGLEQQVNGDLQQRNIAENDGVNTNECQAEKNDCVTNKNKNDSNLLNILLKKELELIQHEKDLLRRENDLLRMIVENERKQKNERFEIDNKNSNDKEVDKTLKKIDFNTKKMNVSFTILKDMIPEYDGGVLPEIWMAQFKSINELYGSDENTKKTLLMCKFKGKAQAWLHSQPNFVFENSDKILGEMEKVFCSKENKLTLRRNFEMRKWRYGEAFPEYYNDKVMLSHKVGIDEDELIDEIIDGIPDVQLKTQAKFQCYAEKELLLRAFSGI